MKINKIIFKIILVILLFLICNPNPYICYARYDEERAEEDFSRPDRKDPAEPEFPEVQVKKENMYPDLEDTGYKPIVNDGTTVKNVISKILGAIMVIGIICIVIFVALTGFGTILGSAGEKAANKEKYVGYIIGAVLVTSGATIAKIIISVAESFG